ncbi:MAG: DUF4388 domain-containing protein [Deltaproteobacteria bacterium]|nr:DUF4388 domain-containing protein [Deltaproteobacteria bacterium]
MTSRIVSLNRDRGIEIPEHILDEMQLKIGDRFLIYREAGVVHLRKVDESATWRAKGERDLKDQEEFLEAVENWFLTNLKGFEKKMTFQGNLESMHLSEILLFLAMSKKTGVLILKGKNVTKKVYFENGEIVFAASTLPEERLGDILLQEGTISGEQYRQSAARIEAGKRQGRVLVEMGVIPPEALWKAVCRQVEGIVHSLFTWEMGYFEFLEGSLPTEEKIKLAVGVPNLILEGMRKVARQGINQVHHPDDSQVVYCLSGEGNEFGGIELTDEEKTLLSRIESGMTVRKVCEQSPLSVEDTKEILFRLIAGGVIRSAKVRGPYVEAVEIEDSATLTARIEQCNMIFRLITEFLRMAVGDRVHVILGAFFRGVDHGQEILFDTVSLEPDGSLDARPLLANIAEYLPEERESILIRGLNELLYFQLFAVRNNLGHQQEKEILTALREMQFLEE